ncbi:MAG: sigma-70 family RNA polymerase sigma factor [Myxococcales bacterium]|nr:sigma-70 family RNA polymerase sigma factor [Myxococcales bacterium]
MVRVQRGEVQAFEALFERYRPRLFGFLVRRCGDSAAAEDLFQETWLRLVRARDRFDPGRRFSTWLFQIANNLCRDRARRLAVESRESKAMQAQIEPDRPGVPPPQHELRRALERRLAALPDRLREVLLLRYYHDLSEREIAAIAGVPPGTVKSRLHAAIRALRTETGRDD